jgi:putative heme-binding domain-containing protein
MPSPAWLNGLRKLALGSAVLLAALATAAAAEVDPGAPAQLARFKVAPGFEVNLFASEEQGVVKPVQMRWDERGRLWVLCCRSYPQIRPGETPDDRILILEDTDGDGRADRTTVFADGLMIPTGLALAPGPGRACYVGEGTTLWRLEDTDGDGRADRREVVLRGFGTGDNHQNINSFQWSPGGDLLFCQGLHGFARVETLWGVTSLDQAGLWRYRPREQRLDAFYGGAADPQNPWGWVFTRWGQPIVSAGNSGTLYYPAPELIRGWQGGRRDPIWTQGRGRKTSNPEIIESAHFPDEWQGALLPGGYINNSVWTLAVARDGAGLRITDHPSLPPLLQSAHGSFRPIDVKLGPDGALYVADWFNPIIGHYQVSLRHPDRDKDHGRIWRVTAKGRPLLTPPRIAGAALPELFDLLRARDRWPREQAKRVLFGGDPAHVAPALRQWLAGLDPRAPDADFALLQALGVFEALESPEFPALERALAAATPELRAYAVATLARWADRLPPGSRLLARLDALADDPDPGVRLAVVVAAGNLARPEVVPALLRVAAQPRDPFIDTALRAAVSVLKPVWLPALDQQPSGWPAQARETLASLDQKRAAPPRAKPAAIRNAPPLVPVLGQRRATPYLTGVVGAAALARGDVARGAELFRRPDLACAACHQVGGEGGRLGPPLDAIGSAHPLELIIGMVLEPQREIREGFETLRLTRQDGSVVIGFTVASNPSEIVLRDPEGREHTIAQADIRLREMIGSLMPAGLTDALTDAEFRDLMAYLGQLGKTP